MNKPDFSQYVIHFTSDRKPLSTPYHKNLASLLEKPAYNKLIAILEAGRLYATTMPWTRGEAVCFTESTWLSLFEHAKRYSPYGIGFKKDFLFATGGGPAFYIRPDIYQRHVEYIKKLTGNDKRPFDTDLHAFLTPFSPAYGPASVRKFLGNKEVDYSHEREWRVPHDLTFKYSDIAFITIATYKDMAQFPKTLKDKIGRDKFLLMENSKKIEDLWPTHIV